MEILQSKVIADGTIKNKVAAGKLLSPVENADSLAVAIYNIDKENKKLKTDSFESDLKLKQAQFNEELKSIDNDGDFQAAIDRHNKEIDDLGNSVLGDKEYQKWQQQKGKNYKQFADLGYKSIWLERKQKENYALLQNNTDKAAVEASMIPSQETAVDSYIFKDIDNAVGLSKEQKEALKNRYLTQKSQAQVLRDIRINPQVALEQLQKTEDVDGIKEPAFYTGLDAVQRQRYIEQAKNVIKSQQGTANETILEPLKTLFRQTFTTSPNSAILQIREIKANPVEYMKKYGLNNSQLDNFLSWADRICDDIDTDFALQRGQQYADLTQQIKFFDIDKNFVIKNKDLNNVESVCEVINTIDNGIKNGTFNGQYQKPVLEQREKLLNALGKMIENNDGKKIIKAENRNYIWQDDTGSNYMRKLINSYANKYNLGLDEKGYLYEHLYKNALLQKIDLASGEINVKQSIDKLFNQIHDDYMKRKYGVPLDIDFDGVISQVNVIGLINEKKQKQAKKGRLNNAYGNYIQTSNGQLVLKDNDGNIIDTVK